MEDNKKNKKKDQEEAGLQSRDLEYAAILGRLIRCETVSVAGNVNAAKFEPFHVLLRETFPALFRVMETEEFEGSLLMKWPGRSSERPILLMSHHDVVEASGKWTHEPFSGDMADGKLWGRGTLDTKNNLWAMMQAAEELAAEGFVPEQDVWFESACTEETSGYGADLITKELQRRGMHFDMVIDEGGYILYDPVGGADHTFAVIGVGEKGCADLKFTARSKGGHASMPGKNTPLVRLGKFMEAVDNSSVFKTEMNQVTVELFRRCGVYTTGAMGFLFRHVGLLKPLLTMVMPKVSNAAGAMLKTTAAFTMAGGSQGTNVLPQEAWVVCNMRYSHHQGQKASIEAIRKIAEKYDVEMEILSSGLESEISDFHSPQFGKMEEAVREVYPDVTPIPYIMTAASDCRFFSRVSENCFRFAPFFITDTQMASIHGIDENINIEGLHKAVDFFKIIIRKA